MNIGVNTFGIKSMLSEDFGGTLKGLKEIGIEEIEPGILFESGLTVPANTIQKGLAEAKMDGFMWMSSSAPEKIQRIRTVGFSVRGAHLALMNQIPGGLLSVLPEMKQFAADNRLSYYVFSPQKSRISDMQKDVHDIRRAINELTPQGISLLLHNHSDELKNDNGDTVFDYLLREIPDLQVELDVGWAQYAGTDVVQLLKKYRDRIAIIHLKDINDGMAKENSKEFFTTVGEGAIPLEEILKEAQKMQLFESECIIDQDDSKGDMLDSLRDGVNHIKKALSA